MIVHIVWIFLLVIESVFSMEAEESIAITCGKHYDGLPHLFTYFTIHCEYLQENHVDHLNNKVSDDTCEMQDYDTQQYERKSLTEAFQIVFSSCELPQIPQQFFERLTEARHIYLTHSGLSVVRKEDFPNESKVEKLVLSNNDLEELPAFLLSRLPNIAVVDFQYNRIGRIHADAFHATHITIKSVILAHNNIEVIDQHLFDELINLEKLDLSHNFIKVFEPILYPLRKLNVLHLDSNQIRQLNCNAVFNLQANDTMIDVSMNQLEEIDWNCDSSSDYISINLDDNHLARLDFPNTKLANGLRWIHASRNRISTISFGRKMVNLRQLDVANNSLSSVSNIFENCRNLKALDLSFNGNVNISSISKLKGIKFLYLNNINLRSIDLNVMSRFENLQHLDISHNELREIDFDTLSTPFRHLTELRLHNNYLTELVGCNNKNLPSLAGISFSNNRFSCDYLDQFLKTFSKAVVVVKDPFPAMPASKRKNIHGVSCIDQNDDSEMDDLNDITAKLNNNTCENSSPEKGQNNSESILHTILLLFISAVCLVFVVMRSCELTKKYRRSRPGFTQRNNSLIITNDELSGL